MKFQALEGLKFQTLEGLKFQNKRTQKQMIQTIEIVVSLFHYGGQSKIWSDFGDVNVILRGIAKGQLISEQNCGVLKF